MAAGFTDWAPSVKALIPPYDLGDTERRYVPDLAGLGRLRRRDTGQVPGFLGSSKVGANVFGHLVAGGVHEDGLAAVRGHRLDRIAVSE